MTGCEALHKDYDGIANKDVKVGELPDWLKVRGKVAYYIYQGPYSGIGEAWVKFHQKVQASEATPDGAPGDIYICDPDDHKGEGQASLMTMFWIPVK